MKRIQARLPRRSVVLLLGAGVLLAAVGAYASIPGPDGVIHGCRHKQSGALRVIDSAATCNTTKEEALNWDQSGSNPVDAYYATDDFENVGGADTVLASMNVPAGSYTVSAKTHLYNTFENSFAVCELRAAGTAIDGNILRLITPANDQVVPFLGAATLASAGTIALVCNGNGVDSVDSENTRIVATAVASIN